MTTLVKLIAKLEAATEGSRELDLEIWRAVSGEHWEWLSLGRDDEIITCDRYGPEAAGNPIVTLDQFSRSLDAALTLVPEGCVWLAGCDYEMPGTAHVHWCGPTIDDRPQNFDCHDAATPALALCIAALKARAA